MNKHFIFLYTSYSEGFGLRPAEAMTCGCCVVTINCGGVTNFAIKNETAYLVNTPPYHEEIANTIFKFFNQPDKAHALAKNGYNKIKRINWTVNLNKFSSLIMNYNGHQKDNKT